MLVHYFSVSKGSAGLAFFLGKATCIGDGKCFLNHNPTSLLINFAVEIACYELFKVAWYSLKIFAQAQISKHSKLFDYLHSQAYLKTIPPPLILDKDRKLK